MEKKEVTNKEKVVALLKSIETKDQKPSQNYVHPNKYIQHNLGIADGPEGFGEFVKMIPPNPTLNMVRVFQEGAYVFTHSVHKLFFPAVTFDIFRFEDGKIVEHWDNLQPKPEKPNPSGRTLIDGSTEIKDQHKTEENKKIAKSFVEEILVNGHMHKLENYFDGENYLQHNPNIGDGVAALRQAFEHMKQQGTPIKYDKIHKVLGEGNFVLVVSEGAFKEQQHAYYDLFRLENGKLAEHWDVLEIIPPKAEWKNQNGKF
ncbi:MAG: nuclear transport factor 2 family protein [Thermonemataceae bacterium]